MGLRPFNPLERLSLALIQYRFPHAVTLASQLPGHGMPILMILLLAAACLPVPWPQPLEPIDAQTVASIAAIFVLGSIALSSFGCILVVRRVPLDRTAAANLYFRLRRRLALWNLWGTVALVLGGWGWAVGQLASDDRGRMAPFAEVLVPAPYLAVLLANWFVWYFAERALHHSAGRSQDFWSLPAYVVQQARQFTLLIFLPVLIIATQQSIARHLPELANSIEYQIASLLFAFGLLLILPMFVKPILGLKRLPAGAIRDRLRATAVRLRFRCTDWLLWPTRGLVANALIVGVISRARYVIFTDRLLDALDPPELEAVVGHEIGHARHWHIPYYFGFFGLSSLVGGTALALFESLPLPASGLGDFTLLFAMGGLGVYIFIVFGFLSRVCERQADLVGVRAASCDDPHCEGHNEETVLNDGGRSICPSGVRAMVRALDIVMQLNGLDRPDRSSLRQWLYAWWKSWQHGPPSHRIDYLLALIDRPEYAARHDRFAFRVRLVLMAGLIGALAGGVWVLGWEEFWRQM